MQPLPSRSSHPRGQGGRREAHSSQTETLQGLGRPAAPRRGGRRGGRVETAVDKAFARKERPVLWLSSGVLPQGEW